MARDTLAYWRQLACRVMRRAGEELNHANPNCLERSKMPITTDKVRDLACAISDG